jgi:hypothetical protein
MSNDLTVVEQKEVEFYDDQLTAVRGDDGRIYASVRQMCDALGLDAQGQRRRMERHAVLDKGLKGVDKLSTPGGIQRGYVLRADLVPLWLSGIRVSAVKEEIRAKLERFQEEAAAVLWEAFQDGRLTADPDFESLLQADSDAVQAYQMAMAVVKLARNQIILESRLDVHEQRLETIEAQLSSPAHVITQSQAMQISQAVKAVALAQGKQTKRNEFGAVYGELYRRYDITSYKLLPAAKFEKAMAFLNEWFGSLNPDEAIPF